MLNPPRLGIKSPLPMFILRGKHITLRHPSPSTKGLGGTLRGVMGCHAPHPMCHRPQAMRVCSPAAARRLSCQILGSSQGHPKTSCLLRGGPAAVANLLGLPRVKPCFLGAKPGVSLPKANSFLLRASSPQHPSTGPPHQCMSPARAGSAPSCRAGVTVAFLGGISQVREEGTAHNSGLCRTAVAPNVCQPF